MYHQTFLFPEHKYSYCTRFKRFCSLTESATKCYFIIGDSLLALIGLLVIASVVISVMTKKIPVHFALVIFPVLGALIAGINVTEVGSFIEGGIGEIASTGVMLIFAVLFFGILFDAGMFDPLVKAVLRLAGRDPMKITIGTAIVGMATQLDGSGSSTYLITISALFPIYRALKMSPIVMAVITGLASGAMNYTPWGGPTIRAATALKLNPTELWVSILPIQGLAIIMVLFTAFFLGLRERSRVGNLKVAVPIGVGAGSSDGGIDGTDAESSYSSPETRRPRLVWVNWLLTVAVVATLISGMFPIVATFLIAVPVALVINYRHSDQQQERLQSHARSAIYTGSVVFAAGALIGIFGETGMIEAIAEYLASAVPNEAGGAFPLLLALVSVPLGLLFDPDSFYFGVLPVLSSTAEQLGISPSSMARAALVGHTTIGAFVSPLVGSTWLLCGLARVDIGDVQRLGLPIALGITTVLSIFALVLGVF